MATKRRFGRRSAVVAVAVGISLLCGVAWAAGGPPTAGQLGTSVVDADCQTATIDTDWAFGYDAAIPGYGITGVILDGLDAGCLDKGIRVVLADSSGAEKASGVGLTPSAGTSTLVLLSPGFELSDPWIGQISIVIHS
jgi:hypothetical protein